MNKNIQRYFQICISVPLISNFTLLFIIYHSRFKFLQKVLIRKSVNLNIRISFYRGVKNDITYKLPNIFNKEVTWLKTKKWALNLFWCSSDLYLYHQIQEPMNNSVWKLLTVFPVNDFPVFLITKCFMLDVKGFLVFSLHAIL